MRFKSSGDWNKLCNACLDNELLTAGFPWHGPIMSAYLKILYNGKGEMGFLISVELVDVVYAQIQLYRYHSVFSSLVLIILPANLLHMYL